MSQSFTPSDYPDGKGPRPDEPLDDLLDVTHSEQKAIVESAVAEMDRLSVVESVVPVRALHR